jgi:hypothetical protein
MQADQARPPFIQLGRQMNQPEPMSGHALGTEDVPGIEICCSSSSTFRSTSPGDGSSSEHKTETTRPRTRNESMLSRTVSGRDQYKPMQRRM